MAIASQAVHQLTELKMLRLYWILERDKVLWTFCVFSEGLMPWGYMVAGQQYTEQEVRAGGLLTQLIGWSAWDEGRRSTPESPFNNLSLKHDEFYSYLWGFDGSQAKLLVDDPTITPVVNTA